jgi:hypothetical protein
MTKIIGINNDKGGVATTTLAAHLAFLGTEFGLSVAGAFQICSGCQIPSYGVRVLIAMNHGFICVDCVKQSIEQIEVARQRDRVLERVRGRMAHLLQLTEPRRPRWVTRLEVRELDVLAQQLDDLTSAYICSRGPFAVVEAPQAAPDVGVADDEDVAEGVSWARRAGAFADDDEQVEDERVARMKDVANPVLRLVEQPSEASTPPEHHIIAFVCETLNAELLDWPTPNMVQFLERHEIEVDDFKVGITSLREELRRRCEFLDPRSQLTLVRCSDAAQTAPPSEAGWAERYAAPHQVSIPVESRCWIERLEAWIRSVDLTPEILAKRAKRDRAAVVSLFRQTDRQTSLRRFLDLVRGANACLCGVPDATSRSRDFQSLHWPRDPASIGLSSARCSTDPNRTQTCGRSSELSSRSTASAK